MREGAEPIAFRQKFVDWYDVLPLADYSKAISFRRRPAITKAIGALFASACFSVFLYVCDCGCDYGCDCERDCGCGCGFAFGPVTGALSPLMRSQARATYRSTICWTRASRPRSPRWTTPAAYVLALPLYMCL